MDHDAITACNRLTVLAVRRRLDGELLPPRHNRGRQPDGQTPISIRTSRTLQDYVWPGDGKPPAPAADPRIVFVREIIASELLRLEPVGLTQHAPRHVSIDNGPAKEVAHLHVRAAGLTRGLFVLLWNYGHLEFRRAVSSDGERRPIDRPSQADLNAVFTQRCSLAQSEIILESAIAIEGQVLAVDLVPVRGADRHQDSLIRREGEFNIILLPDNTTEVHRLTGAVQGSICGDVHAIGLSVVTAETELAWTDAAFPFPVHHSQDKGFL